MCVCVIIPIYIPNGFYSRIVTSAYQIPARPRPRPLPAAVAACYALNGSPAVRGTIAVVSPHGARTSGRNGEIPK